MLLAGDIGGTKTVLAVFSQSAGERAPLAEKTYPSTAYASLEEIAADFLAQTGHQVERGVFGVAGPVMQGRAYVTNLRWNLDEGELARALGLTSVRLLNDLESLAYSVSILEPEDLHTLNVGQAVDHGTRAVIAPGTGLGEAYLTWAGWHYAPHPSEGGHCDFAPRDQREIELLQYLLKKYDHVSCERVCSGLGIPNLYHFLRDTGRATEPPWLAARLAAASDPTPEIFAGAMLPTNPSELCIQTLELFAGILGGEAGNLALKVLATGGVYIGGGIPPRMLPYLEQPAFLENFRDKGRFSDLLGNVPIHVILNPKAALLGAAHAGLEQPPDGS
ncbi:MAG: Glucokinase [Chloroflexi bacterium ADurb.Bin325]|nr:MAG: Glucokinase [Chloroflexi bacterium ADurb.Bin325]